MFLLFPGSQEKGGHWHHVAPSSQTSMSQLHNGEQSQSRNKGIHSITTMIKKKPKRTGTASLSSLLTISIVQNLLSLDSKFRYKYHISQLAESSEETLPRRDITTHSALSCVKNYQMGDQGAHESSQGDLCQIRKKEIVKWLPRWDYRRLFEEEKNLLRKPCWEHVIHQKLSTR